MEEFQHYTDNATFDDAGTSEAMQLLLRIYLEQRETKYRAPLERAIQFVLDSQYPIGGWPQRWPHDPTLAGLCATTSPSTTTSPPRISASC